MKKIKNGAQPDPNGLVTEQQPTGWLAEMHKHFQRTGTYRAEDLERVLGDPREGAEVEATTDFQFGSFLAKS